jgi:predicted Zn-dependent protease
MQGGIPTFLSSHPDPGERERTIQELAQRWEQGANLEVDQANYNDAITGMIMGNNPRQGFVRNGTFYHPELKFSFPVPSGYAVDNQPTQVAMIEQNQNAILIFTFAQESTPQAAASKFSSQEGLTVVDSGRSNVGGNDAAFVLADAQTQDGVAVRVLSYYIAYGGTVYNFLGYSAKQSFNNYQDNFLRTIRGFDRVTDSSILNVQPTRVRIVRADRTAPFRSFIPSNMDDQFTPEDLAIMNQVRLDDQIQRGQEIKLPR